MSQVNAHPEYHITPSVTFTSVRDGHGGHGDHAGRDVRGGRGREAYRHLAALPIRKMSRGVMTLRANRQRVRRPTSRGAYRGVEAGGGRDVRGAKRGVHGCAFRAFHPAFCSRSRSQQWHLPLLREES